MEEYKKPALTFEQQLELLKQRGLVIDSDFEAREILKNISYYRLSGYMHPFLEGDKSKHIFKEGTKLEQVMMLYNFDRHLRLLVLDVIERIEVAFRTHLIYHLSHEYGPWWFEQQDLFSDRNLYAEQLVNLEESIKRSDELFIGHYKNKYTQPNPPAWMVMEIVTFNQLSLWYKNITTKDAKKKIAHHFESNYIELESWIHAIVYIRNVCAHHARLWNRRLMISPKFPQNPGKRFINLNNVTNNRLYFSLSIILYFLDIVNPESSFRKRLLELFNEYTSIDKSVMGFPKEWEKETLWKLS